MPATARMPATVWMQATAVIQATTVSLATSNMKDDINTMTASRNASKAKHDRQHSMGAIKRRDACKNRKTVKWATAWREANGSRDNRNITASTAEGRPATTRMPEIVETSQQQY
jgi:hypothetical protein